jgi:hypothetical protein
LELAAIYRCNWNYGNAIHDANRYLGLASLRDGNVDEAARLLVLSGKSTGSPQLDSFGPDLDLANQLLKHGKIDPVLEYLRDIKRFWKMDNGQLDQWLSAIDRGDKPELDRFSSMKPSPWMIALWWLVIGLPAIAALGFTGASVLCATATSLGEMIVYRAIQGFFGGAITPTVWPVVYTKFQGRQLASVISIISVILSLSSTVGPTVGGFLTDAFSWH